MLSQYFVMMIHSLDLQQGKLDSVLLMLCSHVINHWHLHHVLPEQMNQLELQNSTFSLFISYVKLLFYITDLTGGVITQTQML